ncbi:MAG: diguanylate cyclase, partial [Ruthenibacterium sp.]
LMTGLINRASVENMMIQRLKSADTPYAMMMLDVDNFKKINDTRGHDYGDKVLCAIAAKLRSFFRKADILARMGGDEFAVFIENISDTSWIEKKAIRLCEAISAIVINGEKTQITCSAGIAVSSVQVRSFAELYQNADKALYNAKCRGRNTVSVYGAEPADGTIEKWINDSESVLDAINDSIYACDLNTYEMIYANDNLCKFAGIAREKCKGKKCYEILMHRAEPCTFCPVSKMSENNVYTRLFRIPNVDRIFLLRGKIINRKGVLVHLEIAVDATEIENMGLYEEMTDNEKK